MRQQLFDTLMALEYYSKTQPQEIMGKDGRGQKRWSPEEHSSTSSTFSSHNCDAAFSSFSANFCFPNHRLPRESWSGVRNNRVFIILLQFWRRRSADPLVYLLQCNISMGPTGFNEGKWIGNRSSQLSRSPYIWLPTYAGKTESLNQLVYIYIYRERERERFFIVDIYVDPRHKNLAAPDIVVTSSSSTWKRPLIWRAQMSNISHNNFFKKKKIYFSGLALITFVSTWQLYYVKVAPTNVLTLPWG